MAFFKLIIFRFLDILADPTYREECRPLRTVGVIWETERRLFRRHGGKMPESDFNGWQYLLYTHWMDTRCIHSNGFPRFRRQFFALFRN